MHGGHSRLTLFYHSSTQTQQQKSCRLRPPFHPMHPHLRRPTLRRIDPIILRELRAQQRRQRDARSETPQHPSHGSENKLLIVILRRLLAECHRRNQLEESTRAQTLAAAAGLVRVPVERSQSRPACISHRTIQVDERRSQFSIELLRLERLIATVHRSKSTSSPVFLSHLAAVALVDLHQPRSRLSMPRHLQRPLRRRIRPLQLHAPDNPSPSFLPRSTSSSSNRLCPSHQPVHIQRSTNLIRCRDRKFTLDRTSCCKPWARESLAR